MFTFFKTEPGLRHRFYKYLATKLARNLRNVGHEAELLKQDKEQIETFKRNKSGDSITQSKPKEQDSHDKEFWEIFGLPEDELALQGSYLFFFKKKNILMHFILIFPIHQNILLI